MHLTSQTCVCVCVFVHVGQLREVQVAGVALGHLHCHSPHVRLLRVAQHPRASQTAPAGALRGCSKQVALISQWVGGRDSLILCYVPVHITPPGIAPVFVSFLMATDNFHPDQHVHVSSMATPAFYIANYVEKNKRKLFHNSIIGYIFALTHTVYCS